MDKKLKRKVSKRVKQDMPGTSTSTTIVQDGDGSQETEIVTHSLSNCKLTF